MNVVGTARGLVELTRPTNAIAAGVATFVGAYVSGAAFDARIPVAAAVVATIVGTAAGNAINDYFDRDVDAINAPSRPIPRGAVSPRQGLAWSAVLFGMAVVLTLVVLPILAVMIALVNLVALISYTELFKGLPGAGNALVAYLVGSTFLFGGAAATGRLDSAVVVLFTLAALSTVAREIVKDVEDVEGDRAEGLTTLPIAVGDRAALHVASASTAVAILVSPVPYLNNTLSIGYLAILVPATVLLGYAMYSSYRDPETGQSVYKYAMFVAVVAFVVGRLDPVI